MNVEGACMIIVEAPHFTFKETEVWRASEDMTT